MYRLQGPHGARCHITRGPRRILIDTLSHCDTLLDTGTKTGTEILIFHPPPKKCKTNPRVNKVPKEQFSVRVHYSDIDIPSVPGLGISGLGIGLVKKLV